MSLSCSCNEFDGEGWWWEYPEDFTKLQTSKRKRCCSCKQLINISSECVELTRARYPITEVEINIHGDDCAEVPLASWYLCEYCGEHYFNLTELGYCYNIGEDVREMLKEYQKMTGFIPMSNDVSEESR